MTTVLEFTADLARSTGGLLRQHFQLEGTHASLKSDRSVVTHADLEADQFLRNSISAAFQGELLLSEEHGQTLDRLDRPVWIIDPLDGSTNFSLGLHIWGVLIARLVDGYPDTAVCYFPLLDELYTAQRGEGACLNGQPLHTKAPDKEQPFPFFSCCSRTNRRYHVNLPYKTRILGSGGYTYCLVARGAALLGFEATPKIWDLAAPWLVVEQAGAQIQVHSGQVPFPIRANLDYANEIFPTLAAGSSTLVEKGKKEIQPK